MKNWAGNIVWNPLEIAYPDSEEAIKKLVVLALEQKYKIRLIGTGHSFTPMCATDGISISLDKYQGLISVDKEQCTATVKAGTKLDALGDILFEQGMAMENLGDIDVQSIAGTISTGTHGTGKAFGTISTQIIAIKFINGKGEVISCSEVVNRDLFKAAQVSLGLLGIITEVTIQCVPAYKLAIVNKKENITDVLASWEERNDSNRNFEFYWMTYTDVVVTKTSNLVSEGEPDKVGMFNYWSEYVIENFGFKVLCEIANTFPSKNEFVAKVSAKVIGGSSKIHNSHKIYATQRLVKFKEMEYNIPAESYLDVFKEVMKVVNTKKYNIHFPFESRVVKKDDIYMSPAYNRDSAYIACHIYNKKDHRPYFTDLEEVFRSYGGRPHWGKMNTLSSNDVQDLYPEFPQFMQHRVEQDPDGIFATPYLQQLFGVESVSAKA